MPGPLPEKITIREKYPPAMEIEDEDEAKAYFERCVEHSLRTGATSREGAERVERANIGYFAGYYDHETRMRVQRLFGAVHPIFGNAGTPEAPIEPTPDQCGAAGIALAESALGVLNLPARAELARIIDNEGMDYALRKKTSPFTLGCEDDVALVRAWERYTAAAEALEKLLP